MHWSGLEGYGNNCQKAATPKQSNRTTILLQQRAPASFAKHLTRCWSFISTEAEKPNCLNNPTHQSMYLFSSCQQWLEVASKRLWVTVLHVLCSVTLTLKSRFCQVLLALNLWKGMIKYFWFASLFDTATTVIRKSMTKAICIFFSTHSH